MTRQLFILLPSFEFCCRGDIKCPSDVETCFFLNWQNIFKLLQKWFLQISNLHIHTYIHTLTQLHTYCRTQGITHKTCPRWRVCNYNSICLYRTNHDKTTWMWLWDWSGSSVLQRHTTVSGAVWQTEQHWPLQARCGCVWQHGGTGWQLLYLCL